MKTMKVLFLVIVLSVTAGGTAAQAGVPTPYPKAHTPTLKGAQVLTPGSVALGATTGYPETSVDIYFGLSRVFDLGISAGVTYGHRISGIRQGVGLDLHVPLRFTIFNSGIVAGGFKIAPYFMIGEGSPSISFGGDVAFLIDIAAKKIFKVILGPELRSGFSTYGSSGNRRSIYDGGLWLNAGIETLLSQDWFLGLMLQGGGRWAVGNDSGSDGIFRALLYFAYKF